MANVSANPIAVTSSKFDQSTHHDDGAPDAHEVAAYVNRVRVSFFAVWNCLMRCPAQLWQNQKAKNRILTFMQDRSNHRGPISTADELLELLGGQVGDVLFNAARAVHQVHSPGNPLRTMQL